MKKLFLNTILILLVCGKINAQFGLTEFDVEIEGNELKETLKDSIISFLSNENSLIMSDKYFYIPYTKKEKQELISSLELKKRNLKLLKVLIQWDAQKNEAIIMGYAPIYENLTDTALFYITGNFQKIFSSNIYFSIKEKVKESFFSQINQTDIIANTSNLTFRKIHLDDYECVYHINLSDLPQSFLSKWTRGSVTLYNDPLLRSAIAYSETEKNYNLTKENYKSINIRKIILAEQWTDTTVFHNENEKQANPLPIDMDYLKKEIKSIGLILPHNQIIWMSYIDCMKYYSNSIEEYKYKIYDLFFESSFCRGIKTEVFIK